jgi:hypothetical protein
LPTVILWTTNFAHTQNTYILSCKTYTNFQFVFYSSGSSDIVQQSWALLGKKAALSCNIKPKDPDEKLATVLWYRGSQGEPIFT